MTAVIEASSAGVRDMSDGSLRITFEFEPRHAAEAFALFGPRGRAVAIAALKDGAAAASAKPDDRQGVDQAGPKERERLGALCYRAVMLANDIDFRHWAHGQTHGAHTYSVENEREAAYFIQQRCGVKSRHEFDEDPIAAERFRARILGPWQQYQRGAVK